VVFVAPLTREITDTTEVEGVRKVKLPDVAGPAEVADTTA
jgi:hypothetical protein